jgi:hypothetical protein
MRYPLYLAILMVGMGASAAPIPYNITFTLLEGDLAPVSGSFLYDATIPAFSDFHVVWNGLDLDLTASANSPVALNLAPCSGGTSTPEYGFAIVSGTTNCTSQQLWSAFSTSETTQFVLFASNSPLGVISGMEVSQAIQAAGLGAPSIILAGGTFTITAVPEPASAILILAAFGAGFVRRSVWLRKS